jgi:hypothetical protein
MKLDEKSSSYAGPPVLSFPNKKDTDEIYYLPWPDFYPGIDSKMWRRSRRKAWASMETVEKELVEI